VREDKRFQETLVKNLTWVNFLNALYISHSIIDTRIHVKLTLIVSVLSSSGVRTAYKFKSSEIYVPTTEKRESDSYM